MYLSDERMLGQIERMQKFLCDKGKCESDAENHGYRFPCCAAFLRPTDKLQKPDQAFMSTGEHLPICKIEDCKGRGKRGADVLEYKNMKDISLSSEMFEYLFNKGKIGSKEMSYSELSELYRDFFFLSSSDRVVIYAQEF